MSRSKTLSRLTVASLAAAALAAPAATAKPIDPTGPRPAGMHPLPINRAPAQTVDAGGGDDAPALALVIGGALVLAGGTALTAVRHRVRTAH
jgi:hypothetical protein